MLSAFKPRSQLQLFEPVPLAVVGPTVSDECEHSAVDLQHKTRTAKGKLAESAQLGYSNTALHEGYRNPICTKWIQRSRAAVMVPFQGLHFVIGRSRDRAH